MLAAAVVCTGRVATQPRSLFSLASRALSTVYCVKLPPLVNSVRIFWLLLQGAAEAAVGDV